VITKLYAGTWEEIEEEEWSLVAKPKSWVSVHFPNIVASTRQNLQVPYNEDLGPQPTSLLKNLIRQSKRQNSPEEGVYQGWSETNLTSYACSHLIKSPELPDSSAWFSKPVGSYLSPLEEAKVRYVLHAKDPWFKKKSKEKVAVN
jgi:hypothetical protein